MKTWTSILAAAAILAFAAQAGYAAGGSASGTSKHSIARVGVGPYAYLGSTSPVTKSKHVKHGVARGHIGP